MGAQPAQRRNLQRPAAYGRAVSARRAGEASYVEPVRDGVFFTRPEALPRGRHKLTREQVGSVQRERLLAAMTELLAVHGYRQLSPGHIASRAGVSLAAFYDCFVNKDACVFAGYDRFIEVLLGRMNALDTTGKDRFALFRAVIGTYVETLQSDLVVARAYQVEIDALGPPARERRRQSLKRFAEFIRELLVGATPDGTPPAERPWTAYIGMVYVARQLAADALDSAAEPDLIALGDELQTWMPDLFRER
jgi:AcrR family transcriptional regulator